MDIIKIGAIGITGVLLAVFFRSVKAEYGVYIGVITGLLIFGITLENLAVFMDEVQLFQSIIQADNGFLTILLKIVGITYICEFCAGICRDAGYGAVGGQIEIFGKVMVLLTGLPILLSVVSTIQNFKG
ncbi:MAG: stage III sporulation protein AD [Lachnospiraceae bacterium]|jgi:stage III sporulation protein AD|nr:stage III sporulation protein AD [Lachnospiraceae bacterium]